MYLRVLTEVVLVVALLLVVATAAIVGRERLVRTRRELHARIRSVLPVALVLGFVLALNGVVRQLGEDLSWIVGQNVTGTFYELEGEITATIQSVAHPLLTSYFSYVYIFGYVFLLVFPLVAYFLLSNTRPVRELMVAYTLNYVLGLVLYVLIIAHGPRNLELVEPLMYDAYPRFQHLTRQINRNTNAFPSLHTSLSVTVAIFAYRTREVYPTWLPIAVVLAASVVVSTMYLGLHWAIDVVAGIVLAYVSVALAVRLVGRWSLSSYLSERLGNAPGVLRRN